MDSPRLTAQRSGRPQSLGRREPDGAQGRASVRRSLDRGSPEWRARPWAYDGPAPTVLRCGSCLHPRRRTVAVTYAFFDTPAIHAPPASPASRGPVSDREKSSGYGSDLHGQSLTRHPGIMFPEESPQISSKIVGFTAIVTRPLLERGAGRQPGSHRESSAGAGVPAGSGIPSSHTMTGASSGPGGRKRRSPVALRHSERLRTTSISLCGIRKGRAAAELERSVLRAADDGLR